MLELLGGHPQGQLSKGNISAFSSENKNISGPPSGRLQESKGRERGNGGAPKGVQKDPEPPCSRAEVWEIRNIQKGTKNGEKKRNFMDFT